MFIWKHSLFEADKGSGGTEDAKQTEDATGSKGGDSKPFAVFTNEKDFQEAIDKRLAERLERERKKSEAATQKAREEAESKSLAEQQKYQELAEKRAKALTELETTAAETAAKLEAEQAKAQRYEKALNVYLADQRKRVPEHLYSLLDKLDPVEQLEWISTNGDKLTTANGVPATPKPQAGMTDADRQRAQKETERYYRNKF